MNRSVALTGATGFIGSHLAQSLASAGYAVRTLERTPKRSFPEGDQLAYRVLGDLADKRALTRLVSGAAAIIHCAGAIRGAGRAPFFATNAEGTARLAHIAAEQPRPPRFLLISSLAAAQPTLSPYAASKRSAEAWLESLGSCLPWAILRPPAVYGPGDRGLVPVLGWVRRGVAPVLGAPGGRFSLLYVTDLGTAVLAWLKRPEADRGLYELHDGQPDGYCWNQLIEATARQGRKAVIRIRIPRSLALGAAGINEGLGWVMGRAPLITPGKVRELCYPNWVCDNTAIAHAMDWQPQVSLEEGLATLFPVPGSRSGSRLGS